MPRSDARRARPPSKTLLAQSIKALDIDAVASVLERRRELIAVRDERGRNALHLLCGLDGKAGSPARSLELARRLIAAGIDVNAPAFVEGAFQATPLWYAISRGRNLALAKVLLQKGSTPEFCLWAAAFKDDVAAIDLLIAHGASIDPVTEDETPFFSAIKWSHFAAAERLLRHGANVNYQDSRGRTALHLVLKKNSEKKHVEMLVRHGANPRLEDREGLTPLAMVARRRDKSYVELLSR